MSTTNRHRRLRLHRETLRQLSSPDLARVAGGGGPVQVEARPKSNAWTADGGDVYEVAYCYVKL